MAKRLNIEKFIGKKFNSLKLIKEEHPHITKGGHKHRQGLFICQCGVKKTIQFSTVFSGMTKSCGCHSRKNASDRLKKINKTHGLSKTLEYNIWVSMKKRCLNKNHQSYSDYGGRGIFVCNSWINSFESFINDMGLRPNKKYSLDRINNNDGYYKDNCRWASKKQQSRNQRNNVRLEAFGESKCMSEWALILGFSWQKLHYRIFLSNNYSLIEMLNEIGYSNRN